MLLGVGLTQPRHKQEQLERNPLDLRLLRLVVDLRVQSRGLFPRGLMQLG